MCYINTYHWYETSVLILEMEIQKEVILKIWFTLCEDKYNYKMTATSY